MSWGSWPASLVLTLSLFLVTAGAQAATGVISGNYKFHNLNGNYCDPGVQNCTGATYLKSTFDTLQPLKNARVELWQGNGAIGQGTTDSTGNFKVSWTSSNLNDAWIRFFAQHKDNRFVIGDTDGLRMNVNSSTITLQSGTTSANPQPVGNWTSGSSASWDMRTRSSESPACMPRSWARWSSTTPTPSSPTAFEQRVCAASSPTRSSRPTTARRPTPSSSPDRTDWIGAPECCKVGRPDNSTRIWRRAPMSFTARWATTGSRAWM